MLHHFNGVAKACAAERGDASIEVIIAFAAAALVVDGGCGERAVKNWG